MAEKYELSHFGVCPRYLCGGCRVLPVGASDTPGVETVKLFCPSCLDIYTPPNSRFQAVDGAFFGTTFGCYFFMTFPDYDVGAKSEGPLGYLTADGNRMSTASIPVVDPTSQDNIPIMGTTSQNLAPGLGTGKIYEPTIYGFRVSERSRSGPRMQWLRSKPDDITEVDEARRYFEDHPDSDSDDAIMQRTSPVTTRRKRAPVRRRKQTANVNGGSPMDTNGEAV